MKLVIDNNYRQNTVTVFIEITQRGYFSEYLFITGNRLGVQTIDNSLAEIQEIPPFLHDVPKNIWNDLLKGLIDHAASQGIRPTEANYTEGKLEATEKHLSDLRQYMPKLLEFATQPSVTLQEIKSE